MAARKAAARPLHAVEPDEAPARPKRAPSIAQAARDDDDLAMYKALKVRTARKLDDPKCNLTQFAALSRRLLELNDLIRALEGGGPDGGDDNPSPVASAAPDDEEWDSEAL